MSIRLPTQRQDVRLVARTIRLVLSVPAYAAFAVLTAGLSLTLFVLSQNLALVDDLLIGGPLPLSDRVTILTQLYPFVGNSYRTIDGLAIVVVSLLVGANLALLAYHVRNHDLSASGSGGSLLGVVFGVLGAGCAACGSALLLGVLSLFGASGLLLALPLHGLELSILAVITLLLSTYWLADGMRGGQVDGCPIDVSR